MNKNKKTKIKKVNDAINNMGNSTSFESLKNKDKKNNHEGLK
ncbi:hypothetical protein [Clostridium estertheticum]|nr:hypothetical protein [Clostridium estertheticum]